MEKHFWLKFILVNGGILFAAMLLLGTMLAGFD